MTFKDKPARPGVTILIDLAALLFIWLIPDISRLTQIPLYLLEPTRLMLVIMLLHTPKINAFLMAAALPVFVFVLGGHPQIPKMVLLSAELLLNAGLFFLLVKWIGHPFIRMAVSIVISKCVYYLLKWTVITGGFLEGPIIATPIYIQVLLVIALSAYTWLIFSFFRKSC